MGFSALFPKESETVASPVLCRMRSAVEPTLTAEQCKHVKKQLDVPFGSYGDIDSVVSSFPNLTLPGALSLYHSLRVARAKRQHRLVSESAHHHLKQYMHRDSNLGILELSKHVDMPPCSLFRLLVSTLSPSTQKRDITEWIRRPWKIPSAVQTSVDHDETTVRRLCRDAERCLAWDDTQSPAAETMRQAAGGSSEGRLDKCLRDLDVPFRTEQELRNMEQVKTPDVLLHVPIAFASQPVHWIDSKSTFGDSLAMRDAASQLVGYTNRFGPGMVIFWHGFAEGLEQHEGVLVASGFPDRSEIELLQSPITSHNSDRQ